jgi:aminoglycoside phosphotransferase (APT) family kinase protein
VDTPPAEVSIDAALVSRLISAQHPSLLAPVSWFSSGWDNELFRLGDDYVVRMPRRALAVSLIEHEQRWLPELQRLVDVPIPVPVALGLPSDDYAWPWSIARWLAGEPVAHRPVSARGALVEPLAEFVVSLHVPAPADAPMNPVRGTPLATRDEAVRGRLGSGSIPHADELLEVWERAVAAPVYSGPPIWMHGDLHPINVLADASGALSAVIDFGDLGGADPACDLAAAWLFFDAEQRAAFRARIGTDALHDESAWERARGWAVAEATAFVQNSGDAPVLDAIGRHAVDQLVAEL